MGEVSGIFNISPEHFSRSFKKETGVTPIRYMNELRIAEAKRLLAEHDFSVKEIAAKLFYTDPFYFLFFANTGSIDDITTTDDSAVSHAAGICFSINYYGYTQIFYEYGYCGRNSNFVMYPDCSSGRLFFRPASLSREKPCDAADSIV